MNDLVANPESLNPPLLYELLEVYFLVNGEHLSTPFRMCGNIREGREVQWRPDQLTNYGTYKSNYFEIEAENVSEGQASPRPTLSLPNDWAIVESSGKDFPEWVGARIIHRKVYKDTLRGERLDGMFNPFDADVLTITRLVSEQDEVTFETRYLLDLEEDKFGIRASNKICSFTWGTVRERTVTPRRSLGRFQVDKTTNVGSPAINLGNDAADNVLAAILAATPGENEDPLSLDHFQMTFDRQPPPGEFAAAGVTYNILTYQGPTNENRLRLDGLSVDAPTVGLNTINPSQQAIIIATGGRVDTQEGITTDITRKVYDNFQHSGQRILGFTPDPPIFINITERTGPDVTEEYLDFSCASCPVRPDRLIRNCNYTEPDCIERVAADPNIPNDRIPINVFYALRNRLR